MTYLELVNAVLTRMREDEVNTLSGQSDVVVNLVKDFVNDAKQVVEDAHTWNALSSEWTVTTANGTSRYSLTNSSNSAIIKSVYSSNGTALTNVPLERIRKNNLVGISNSKPSMWAVDGVDSQRDVRITVHPTPDSADTIYVFGFNKQNELSADTDVLLVPSKPVLYYAYALAARERGEVGGQTAAELFTVAGQYLRDAVAYDAELNGLDNVWYSV